MPLSLAFAVGHEADDMCKLLGRGLFELCYRGKLANELLVYKLNVGLLSDWIFREHMLEVGGHAAYLYNDRMLVLTANAEGKLIVTGLHVKDNYAIMSEKWRWYMQPWSKNIPDRVAAGVTICRTTGTLGLEACPELSVGAAEAFLLVLKQDKESIFLVDWTETYWGKEPELWQCRMYKMLVPFDGLHANMAGNASPLSKVGDLLKETGGKHMVLDFAKDIHKISPRLAEELASWYRSSCKGLFQCKMPCCVGEGCSHEREVGARRHESKPVGGAGSWPGEVVSFQQVIDVSDSSYLLLPSDLGAAGACRRLPPPPVGVTQMHSVVRSSRSQGSGWLPNTVPCRFSQRGFGASMRHTYPGVADGAQPLAALLPPMGVAGVHSVIKGTTSQGPGRRPNLGWCLSFQHVSAKIAMTLSLGSLTVPSRWRSPLSHTACFAHWDGWVCCRARVSRGDAPVGGDHRDRGQVLQ